MKSNLLAIVFLVISLLQLSCAKIVERDRSKALAQGNIPEESHGEVPCSSGLLDSFHSWGIYLNSSAQLRKLSLIGGAAIRNDAEISSSVIGQGLVSNKERADLVVGRRLNFITGQVPNGKAFVGVGATLGSSVQVLGGVEILNETPWSQNEKILTDLSKSFMTFKSNASAEKICQTSGNQDVCQLNLVGTQNEANVFEIFASDLNESSVLNLNIPLDSSATINVIGAQSVVLQDMVFNFASTVDSRRVLFNFAQSKNIQILRSSINGVLLAPFANLKLVNVELIGQLIGSGLETNCSKKDACTEIVAQSFVGCLPKW